jgi:hypothetical protein
MQVLGARLVHASRARDLVERGDEPLPPAHEHLSAPAFPGEADERFLVLELDAAAAGETATVSIYPVERGGRAEIVASRAGRQRVAVRLTPTLVAPGTLMVDAEQDGEELWSDELRVEKTESPAPAPVEPRAVEEARSHDLRIHIEPQRVIAEFRCAAPTLVVATTGPGNRFLVPLDWRGPGCWFAESARRAEELPEATRNAVARLLGQATLGEARFDPWGGRIALVVPELDPARAERIVQEIGELVALLPPPTGEVPPEGRWSTSREPSNGSTLRAELPVVQVRLLERERAAQLAADLEKPLPHEHDPVHGPWLDGPTAPRALLIETQLTPAAHVLTVWSDPTVCPRVDIQVPAGSGRWRHELPLAIDLWTEGFLEIGLQRPTGWQAARARVPIGRSGTVVLDELAARIPGARRRSDHTVAITPAGSPEVVLRLVLDFGDGPPFEWDPIRRFGKRLFRNRLASLAGDIDGKPGGSLRELRASVALPFEVASASGSTRDFRIEDDHGRIAFVADITSADVCRVEEVARAMLEAATRLGRRAGRLWP